MTFYKLKQHAIPGICTPKLFDDSERKHIQHQIANYVKQCIKKKLDKGPDGMRVTISDNMIIIRIERYLTKMEKYVIEKEPNGVETVRCMRTGAATGIINEGEIIFFMEKLVQAKAVYALYDSYPQDEYCVMLFMFDRILA